MHHFFVNEEQIQEKSVTITGEDVNHIRNVLRMKPGEELRVCTGRDDRDFRCRIESLTESAVNLEILWVEHSRAELPCEITLFQGLPKGDKMELIIQKAVELGARRIVPVAMHRCVTRLEAKKAQNKVRRWNAISESAAKQSRRMFIPSVEQVQTFAEAAAAARDMDMVLVSYEMETDASATRQALSVLRPGMSIGIFIGPEGGLEEQEVQTLMEQGARSITLGKRILRTETAGMALLAYLMMKLDVEI